MSCLIFRDSLRSAANAKHDATSAASANGANLWGCKCARNPRRTREKRQLVGIQDPSATLRFTTHPTLQQLKDAAGRGLQVRNPDNGHLFRVVYWTWEGCIYGVRLFELGRTRPAKSPLMSPVEIESWLSGLESAPG